MFGLNTQEKLNKVWLPILEVCEFDELTVTLVSNNLILKGMLDETLKHLTIDHVRENSRENLEKATRINLREVAEKFIEFLELDYNLVD